MKYRHQYHAGNLGDVHKHVSLVALLRAMQRKDKGFFFLDTHAGRGRYDLNPESAAATVSRQVAAQIASTEPTREQRPFELHDWQQTQSTASGSPNALAGSPLLAAALMRSQDRGVCVETEAPEQRALKSALEPWRNVRALHGDGFAALTAYLPPPERRALVLIDPPYEEPRLEQQQALEACKTALKRLAAAVVAVWYPIKDDRQLAPWLRQCAAAWPAPTLRSELWRYPRDSSVALNGSGLLIVNPPFELDRRMRHWLPTLATLLGCDAQGGSRVDWLIAENEPLTKRN